MADYRIIVSPEADAQLIALYRYIAVEASPRTAERFVDSILDQCEKLSRFPDRGAPRGDLRPVPLELQVWHGVLRVGAW